MGFVASYGSATDRRACARAMVANAPPSSPRSSPQPATCPTRSLTVKSPSRHPMAPRISPAYAPGSAVPQSGRRPRPRFGRRRSSPSTCCGTKVKICAPYPLSRRLQVLETFGLRGALIAVDTFPGKAAEVLDFARAHHLEGAVVKRPIPSTDRAARRRG